MKSYLISHRGNLFGPNLDLENTVPYIETALSEGFDVEIDIWYINNEWYLGHDSPQKSPVKLDFFVTNRNKLWIHCKNYEALREMCAYERYFNYFYHANDNYTLTSRGFIWAYPGNKGGKNTIAVLPDTYLDLHLNDFEGICSDFIGLYMK